MGNAAEDGADGRKLGFFDTTMLVMGGIVGVGIFFTPGSVAGHVPEPALFLCLWGVGGLIALCGAMTFAELGATFPRSGGWYVFLREAFGPFPAFLFAWMILGVVSTGAIAVIATIGVSLLGGVVPALEEAGAAGRLWVALAIILSITGITSCGVKVGATFQNFCMITKLVAILALAAAGIAFFTPGSETAVVAPAARSQGSSLFEGAIAAMLPVFFSYGGWQNVCYIAPEVVNPTRTLPRAILAGVLAAALVYLVINVAYLEVFGIGGLATTENFATVMAARCLGAGFDRALSAAMAVSAIGVCAVVIIVSPGIYVAMARDGLFFASFGRQHPRTGAPVLALLAQAFLAAGYLLWSHLDVFVTFTEEEKKTRMDADALTGSVVFAEWIFHGLVALGLILIRARRPELPRPFRSPLWPAAPVLYLVTAAAVVLGNLWISDARQTGIGCAVLLIGALVYWPWRRMFARSS